VNRRRVWVIGLLSALLTWVGSPAPRAYPFPRADAPLSSTAQVGERVDSTQEALVAAVRAARRSGLPLVTPADAPPPTGLAPWRWPLDGPGLVVHPFDGPARPWLPGHRGVDLASADDVQVRAVAEGRVRFAGPVAGVHVVSVRHGDGVVSTYQPVRASVRTADSVARGQVLGRLQRPGGHCAPALCLHLGARRDGAYVDPMLLLQAWQVSLLPYG